MPTNRNKREEDKKREREKGETRRRTGSAKSMACLITALHERYALAAHENTYIHLCTYVLACLYANYLYKVLQKKSFTFSDLTCNT